MKKLNSRPITLIEVLISMGLVSILLTALFGTYSYLIKIHNETSRVSTENTKLLFAQHKLSQIIPAIMELPIAGDEKLMLPFFISEYDSSYNKGQSLVFVYNNKANGQPNFSNDVLGRLYLSEKGDLTLMTWPWILDPNEQTLPVHKEILLSGIESLKFFGYLPPPLSTVENAGRGNGGWEPTWPFQYSTEETEEENKKHPLPPMLKIVLELKNAPNNDMTFSYVLPNSSAHVIYSK